MVVNHGLRAIVWDMGGVFIKTEDPLPRIQLAEKLGISRHLLEDLVFSRLDTALKAEKGEISQEQHCEAIRAYFNLTKTDLDNFITRFWAGDRLDVELLDYVYKLKGKYKVALISNAWSGTRAYIHTLYPALLNVFDETIFSAEIGMIKPDVGIFSCMLQKLDVRPFEAVFIDDVMRNVEGARVVGMHAIQYLNTQQVLHELEVLLSSPE